jgi:hypothetical protein
MPHSDHAHLHDLQAEEIQRLLETALPPHGDVKIVDDIYEFSQRQLASEDTRSAKLDARATSILGAAAISTTLAFSAGGWALLDNVQKVPLGTALAVAFVVIVVLGLGTGLFALLGLLLRANVHYVDERQIYHPSVLALGRNQADFRLHVATHVWLIWQSRRRRNEERSKAIVRGQWCFLAFLFGILALTCMTAWSAVNRPFH